MFIKINAMYFIVWLILFGETTCVNFVLRKSLTSCSIEYESPEITDGNRFRQAGTIQEMCFDGNLMFKLPHVYYVQTMVLFGGDSLINNKIRYGSSFSINSNAGACGRYVKRKNIAFQGMRVNCEENQSPLNKIFIKFEVLPFYLAEFEVHTLASGKPGEIVMIYRGCFSKFAVAEEKHLSSFQMCGQHCSSKPFTYVALQGDRCLCGNNTEMTDLKSESLCDFPCDSSDYHCGGIVSFSVYLVQIHLPFYKGCATSSHTSEVQSDDMTVTKCLLRCDKNYFATLKNGTSCACINDESKFSFVNFDSCTVPCAGDPNSYCGGSTYWSVYGTCFKNNPPTLSCSMLFRCAKSWDEFGVCEGGCEEQYFGEHCIERVSNVVKDICLNSSPCEYMPNTTCLYNSIMGSHNCVCIKGHWNIEENDSCPDIDECLFDSCDEKSSICSNTLGSFKCNCKLGFKLDGIICHDIDECLNNPCNNESTICENKLGDYECKCISGYTVLSKHACRVLEKPGITKSPLYLCPAPDPCKDIPNSFCYFNMESTIKPKQCLCVDGYWENEIDRCEDIDECMFEACDNRTSTCLNTNGSFACACHREYRQFAADVCLKNVSAIYNLLLPNIPPYILLFISGLTTLGVLLGFRKKVDKSSESTDSPSGT